LKTEISGDEFVAEESFPVKIVVIVSVVVVVVVGLIIMFALLACRDKAIKKKTKMCCFDGKKLGQKKKQSDDKYLETTDQPIPKLNKKLCWWVEHKDN